MMKNNMQNESNLMRDFQAHILHGDAAIVAKIADGPRINGVAGLSIYARAYRSRLQDILDNDYPALHVLAGDELFGQIAQAYIAAQTSIYPNARWFGTHLPEFLQTDERFVSLAVLREMATFERAMGLVFDAADEHVVVIDELAALSGEAWPLLCLRMQSSLQLVVMRWNGPAFWQAVQDERDPPTLLESEADTSWAVWRRGYSVYFRSLEADEAWALHAAIANATFANLCEGLYEWHDAESVAARAITILKQWITDEMITMLNVSVA